jgi:hypothetical protein
MSLKTATVIALAGVLLQGILYLLTTFEAIHFTSRDGYKLYSVVSLLLSNGTLALFLAVLLSKQNNAEKNE